MLDRFGNLVTFDTSNVTVALGTNPGGGTLSGTTTLAAVAGVATFSTLSIDKTGVYTLNGKPVNIHEITDAIHQKFTKAKAVYVRADNHLITIPLADDRPARDLPIKGELTVQNVVYDAAGDGFIATGMAQLS